MTGIHICQLCHRGLHKLYDEMTLAKEYASVDRLLADAEVCKHIDWVKKQKRGLMLNISGRNLTDRDLSFRGPARFKLS